MPLSFEFEFTLRQVFTVIVDHPTWSRPKVLDMIAEDREDVALTVHAIYGDQALVGLISVAQELVQGLVDMPAVDPSTLFWTASRNGVEQWTVAADREQAARHHHQQTQHAAAFILPAPDLIAEVERLSQLVEQQGRGMVISHRMLPPMAA